MEHRYWHQKWASNDLGFHENDANQLLVKHIDRLSLANGQRVFVPLCGKTVDIAWLMSRGLRVAGAELSAVAVHELFSNMGVNPEITTQGAMQHFHARDIDIFVGDVLELSSDLLGSVDAVYDRAAFVALPSDMRVNYSRHLISATRAAQQLLITFEYDQAVMPGPPFSISNEEVQQHYGASYRITHVSDIDVAGGLKGKCQATENVWHLTPV